MDDAVRTFLDGVTHPVRRRDALALVELFERVTALPATMWGTSIVAFGQYHYKYASGREGDAPAAGFSPRKAVSTIYLPDGIGAYPRELERLGAHTTGVGCLYLKNLDDVDVSVLESIVSRSFSTVTAGTFGYRATESAGRDSA